MADSHALAVGFGGFLYCWALPAFPGIADFLFLLSPGYDCQEGPLWRGDASELGTPPTLGRCQALPLSNLVRITFVIESYSTDKMERVIIPVLKDERKHIKIFKGLFEQNSM